MKRFLALVLSVTSLQVLADCKSIQGLEGMVSIPGCDAGACVPGAEAVYGYSEKIDGHDDPNVLVLTLHSSPWRFYDGEMRVLTVDELAEMARPSIEKGVKRIVLMASWSGVVPGRHEKSLAQKLSAALNGFPVAGVDGFLWIARDGSTRTTRQAFSVRKGRGPYRIEAGAEVMVSLVAGWPAGLEEEYRREKDAGGVMRAGAGWDIFFLCPDKALQSFEAAAQLSDPVAAYNAAMIRLERRRKGDVELAKAWLMKSANAGDTKARERLRMLKQNGG